MNTRLADVEKQLEASREREKVVVDETEKKYRDEIDGTDLEEKESIRVTSCSAVRSTRFEAAAEAKGI